MLRVNPCIIRKQRSLSASLIAALAAMGACVTDAAQATSFTVTSCNDNGPGTLRGIIEAATTHSNDTVTFSSQLACSTITLTSGQIPVSQNNLTITGPGAGLFTIDGSFNGRIFRHYGTGTLSINGLTMQHGKILSAAQAVHASGGCLFSSGNISLTDSTLYECLAQGTGNASAYGGGVFTQGDLTLSNSRIANSFVAGQTPVPGPYVTVEGGGAFVTGNLQCSYSTFVYNVSLKRGGALYTLGNAEISNTTMSHNTAAIAGAWGARPTSANNFAVLASSTISGNTVSSNAAAIFSEVTLGIYDSTIAFNQADIASGGIYAAAPTTIQNSIIADNTVRYTSGNQQSDVSVFPSTRTISGNHDLVSASSAAMPTDTLVACPKLGGLVNNGGVTLTHALAHDSPAIDTGSAPLSFFYDQRGPGFSRLYGAHADIGAYEWHGAKDDRIFAARFESTCDN